jgi:rod shape determining protein RodA
MSVLVRMRQPATLIGLFCVLGLCAIAIENLNFADSMLGTTYHRSQTIWIVIGLIGMGVTAGLDMQFVRRLSPLAYQVLVVLLVAVLFFGREINYSKRWLELGPANIQPSEFMKLSIALVLADWFDKKRSQVPWKLRQLLMPLALMALPVALINREPDLGTSVCVAAIAIGQLLYDGVQRRTLLLALCVAVIGVGLAWKFDVIRDYQKGRAETWWHAMQDDDKTPDLGQGGANRDNWQAEKALWAVGSGRVAGRSDDEARVSVLRHVPFVHTDFALACFAERWGLIGCIFLFSLYLGFVWWALHIADRALERFDALLAVGVAGLVFWQFFVNSGMVIGLLPVVGVTLPLLSYGGSSALTVLIGAGFLLNISTRRKPR